MGKEEVRSARRTEARDPNIGQPQSSASELRTRNGDEVEVHGRNGARMASGRLGGEKERWVTPGERPRATGGGCRAKELLAVRKAAAKGSDNVFPHFIAASTDGRPKRRPQVGRVRTKHAAHLTHGLLHNALQCATPPHVDDSDSAFPEVRKQDGQAVRGPHGEQDAGLIGHEGIAWRQTIGPSTRRRIARRTIFELSRRSLHDLVDHSRVGLPDCGKGETLCAELSKKQPPVFLDLRAPVPLGKAEVKPRCRRSAYASPPRAEGMEQPGEASKRAGLDPLQPPTRDDFESSAPQTFNIAHDGKTISPAGAIEFSSALCYGQGHAANRGAVS